MNKIKHYELQKLFDQRNERAKELIELFRNEDQNNNPLVISGYKTRAVREANDEMFVRLLEKLDLLEKNKSAFFTFSLFTTLVNVSDFNRFSIFQTFHVTTVIVIRRINLYSLFICFPPFVYNRFIATAIVGGEKQ